MGVIVKLLISVPDFELPKYGDVQDEITLAFGIHPPAKTLFYGQGYTVEQDNAGTPWLVVKSEVEFEVLNAFKDEDKVGAIYDLP